MKTLSYKSDIEPGGTSVSWASCRGRLEDEFLLPSCSVPADWWQLDLIMVMAPEVDFWLGGFLCRTMVAGSGGLSSDMWGNLSDQVL